MFKKGSIRGWYNPVVLLHTASALLATDLVVIVNDRHADAVVADTGTIIAHLAKGVIHASGLCHRLRLV